jgi:DNA polymerase-3 subunit chi
MNTQVDFYLLENPEQSVAGFCCKLVEKAYHQGHDIFIQVEADEALHHLDDLLWTFRQDSFLPHAIPTDDEPIRKHSPIRLGHCGENNGKKDVLINLSGTPSAEISKYQRIAEIVSAEETDKAIARNKFKSYQAQGIRPTHHKIS